MKVYGILDRFTDREQAVILIEEMNEELIVSKHDLPEGSRVNTYCLLEKSGETYEMITIDEEKARQKAQSSADLMKKLRAKSRGSKFKKNKYAGFFKEQGPKIYSNVEAPFISEWSLFSYLFYIGHMDELET